MCRPGTRMLTVVYFVITKENFVVMSFVEGKN